MIKIRRNVFETNSSSTHSIAIPKEYDKRHLKFVHFRIEYFGWKFRKAKAASYLYTAILTYYYTDKERNEKIEKIKSVLDKYNIKYSFDEPKWRKHEIDGETYNFLDNGDIDHSEELGDFLKAVFKNEKTLLSFIFHGLVFTGTDNCDRLQHAYVYRNSPTYEILSGYNETKQEWEHIEKINPYYKDKYENFNWYFKEN